MPLTDYLTENRVVLLGAADRAGALAELVAAATADQPELDHESVLSAVRSREEGLSTCIAPGIALPHARLPGLDRFLIAVGLSRAGIAWGADGQVVHLIAMLLGDADQPDNHLQILAEIARVLREEDVLREARAADSTGELYDLLVRTQRGGELPRDEQKQRINRTVLARALELAGELNASAVMVHADDALDLSFLPPLPSPMRLLLVSSHLRRHEAFRDRFAGRFDVPFTGGGSESLFELALLLAMSDGLIDSHDTILCTWGRPGSGRLDSMSVVDMAERFNLLLSLRSEWITGDVQHQVLNRMLGIASMLGREGREGKPVGALFVLGDYPGVSAHCRQMVINPFKGYGEDQRSVLDPSLEETIKEFSVIDGAIVVRGDGIIMSAGTYLSNPSHDVDLPAGLGARHAAAAGITRTTRALTVTISESTGMVRLYARGQAIMILPRDGG